MSGSDGSRSVLSRLMSDPVALRRRGWAGALAVGALAGLAGSDWLLSDTISSALMALCWLLVPVAAAAIGIGDAFFLRHGVGQRRVAVTLVLAALASLASCVTLAIIGMQEGRPLLIGLFYAVLVVAVTAGLAALIAVGFGRGESYLSRKIQDVDDTGW